MCVVLCCVVCFSELRLARVEERTEYAHKLDDYFKQKSAQHAHNCTNTDNSLPISLSLSLLSTCLTLCLLLLCCVVMCWCAGMRRGSSC